MLAMNVMMLTASIRRGKARAALNNRSGAVEDFKKVMHCNCASVQFFKLPNVCNNLLSQVLSFDPSNAFAQTELKQLDGSASTSAAIDAVASTPTSTAAKSAARPTLLPSSMSQAIPPSSGTACSVKEPSAKTNSFKPGFLNPQPAVPRPRRIEIKEDSDESDGEKVSGHSALDSAASSHVSSPLKPSRATITAAAAAAAAAVTDEDIVARAARIASLNVRFLVSCIPAFCVSIT